MDLDGFFHRRVDVVLGGGFREPLVDREGPSRHCEHRDAAEKGGELLRVHRRRRDDYPDVSPSLRDLFEDPEEHVRVEGPNR